VGFELQHLSRCLVGLQEIVTRLLFVYAQCFRHTVDEIASSLPQQWYTLAVELSFAWKEMQFPTPCANRGLSRPDWQFRLIFGSDWPSFNRVRQMLFVCYWYMDLLTYFMEQSPSWEA